ncbi:MAG: DUF423 domain-containing protein [Pirellulaceae bacterium]|nr:DUF423 domain-containing protein [Pirellulaceae bacterium]
MSRVIIIAAGIVGGLSVMLGAYAAHGLPENLQRQALEPDAIVKRVQQCEVGVRYQMVHSVALLALGLSAVSRRRPAQLAAVLWMLGIALFCGGLYSISLLGVLGHWAIVPSGGLCLMIGWLCIVWLGIGRSHGNPADDRK